MSADDRTVSWDEVRAKRPPNEQEVARHRARFDRDLANRFVAESSAVFHEPVDADEIAELLKEARRQR